jgi:hypothetical protein
MRNTHLHTALLTEYDALAERPRAELSYDQRRGVRFHLAERSLLVGVAPPTEVGIQVLRWTAGRARLEAFIATNARMPRQNSRLDPGTIGLEEKFLAEWVRSRRKAHRDGTLCDFQTRRLELIHGFQWDPTGELWRARFSGYAEFLTTSRRSPSERSPGESERSLARWATSQRGAHRADRLNRERAERLESLSIWSW